jgi:hypothetical protein
VTGVVPGGVGLSFGELDLLQAIHAPAETARAATSKNGVRFVFTGYLDVGAALDVAGDHGDRSVRTRGQDASC